MLIKLFLFFVIMILLPLAAGLLYTAKPVKAYFCGFLTMMTLYELLAVPAVFMRLPLHLLTIVWGAAMAVLAILGLWLQRRAWAGVKGCLSWWEDWKKNGIPWLLLLSILLILLQAVRVAYMQHIDNDDAFYVATSVTNVETDSVFRFNPYTGEAYRVLPARYLLAAWPTFISTLSQITGFHATVLAHTLLPGLLLVMGYLVFGLMGDRLFAGDRKKQGMFLLFVCLMTAYGCFTRRNAANLFFVRIWQGKAMLGGIFLPACFYVPWLAMKEKGGFREWLLLFELVTTSCMVTSISVALVPCVLGSLALIYTISRRSVSYLLKTVLCCMPAVLCGGIYLLIH